MFCRADLSTNSDGILEGVERPGEVPELRVTASVYDVGIIKLNSRRSVSGRKFQRFSNHNYTGSVHHDPAQASDRARS